MRRRFWLIFSAVAVAGLGFLVFSIWRPGVEKKEVLEERPVTGTQQSISESQKLPQKEPELVFVEPEIPKLIFSAEGGSASGGKPFFEEEGEKIKETFLDRFSVLTNSAEIPVFTPEVGPIIVQPMPKKTLTDEEWFKIIYPEDYLAYLAELETIMKEEGFLATSEKFEFKSEEEITSFLHEAINFLFQEKILTEEGAKNLRNGIDVVLPNLQKEERSHLEAKLSVILFKLNRRTEKFSLFNGVKCLIDSFFRTEAWAFVSFCEEGVLCFRAGAPAPIGTNLWAPCCCCKYKKHMIGCLNSVCPSPASAIWDPMTGICGCG